MKTKRNEKSKKSKNPKGSPKNKTVVFYKLSNLLPKI